MERSERAEIAVKQTLQALLELKASRDEDAPVDERFEAHARALTALTQAVIQVTGELFFPDEPTVGEMLELTPEQRAELEAPDE